MASGWRRRLFSRAMDCLSPRHYLAGEALNGSPQARRSIEGSFTGGDNPHPDKVGRH